MLITVVYSVKECLSALCWFCRHWYHQWSCWSGFVHILSSTCSPT